MKIVKTIKEGFWTVFWLLVFSAWCVFLLATLGMNSPGPWAIVNLVGSALSLGTSFCFYKAWKAPPDPVRHAGAVAGYALIAWVAIVAGWIGTILAVTGSILAYQFFYF